MIDRVFRSMSVHWHWRRYREVKKIKKDSKGRQTANSSRSLSFINHVLRARVRSLSRCYLFYHIVFIVPYFFGKRKKKWNKRHKDDCCIRRVYHRLLIARVVMQIRKYWFFFFTWNVYVTRWEVIEGVLHAAIIQTRGANYYTFRTYFENTDNNAVQHRAAFSRRFQSSENRKHFTDEPWKPIRGRDSRESHRPRGSWRNEIRPWATSGETSRRYTALRAYINADDYCERLPDYCSTPSTFALQSRTWRRRHYF